MGKANKVKNELADAVVMVDLIQTLKDIADNKFYMLSKQKHKFRRFGESFVDFFRLVKLTGADHPLIKNDNPAVGILVVTIEGSFLGAFNNKILRRAIEEKNTHENSQFIAIGQKGADRLMQYTPNLKKFINMNKIGMYQMAIAVKDYLVDQVVSGALGKIYVVYSWPKSFEIQKPRVVKLLPCDDLVRKQSQFADEFENVIGESAPGDVIGFLCNLWITTRLSEIFMDTMIASSAAQASFLEDSVDKMKKERAKVKVKYRKAKKGDIDKSLRETFSARMMTAQ